MVEDEEPDQILRVIIYQRWRFLLKLEVHRWAYEKVQSLTKVWSSKETLSGATGALIVFWRECKMAQWFSITGSFLSYVYLLYNPAIPLVIVQEK